MPDSRLLAALTAASIFPAQSGYPHGFAGPHMLISTVLIGKPIVQWWQ